MHEWERIAVCPYIDTYQPDSKHAGVAYTDRMRVPGGWIYRTYRFNFNQASESSVFVPVSEE